MVAIKCKFEDSNLRTKTYDELSIGVRVMSEICPRYKSLHKKISGDYKENIIALPEYMRDVAGSMIDKNLELYIERKKEGDLETLLVCSTLSNQYWIGLGKYEHAVHMEIVLCEGEERILANLYYLDKKAPPHQVGFLRIDETEPKIEEEEEDRVKEPKIKEIGGFFSFNGRAKTKMNKNGFSYSRIVVTSDLSEMVYDGGSELIKMELPFEISVKKRGRVSKNKNKGIKKMNYGIQNAGIYFNFLNSLQKNRPKEIQKLKA